MVKFYTLLLLYENPKHGYDIIKEISKKIGKEVSSGQIYPFLNRLVQQKYVTFKESGAREKKTYRLTVPGRNFVKVQLSRFGDLIDIAIEPRIKVCTHCGCKVLSGGHTEKIGNKRLIFCCQHCAKTYSSKH